MVVLKYWKQHKHIAPKLIYFFFQAYPLIKVGCQFISICGTFCCQSGLCTLQNKNVWLFVDFKSGFGDSSSGRRCLLQCDRCRTGALQCRWLQVYIAAAGSAKLFLLLHYLILHGCVSPCLHFPVFFIALWNDNAICVFLYRECMEHQQCLLNVQWDSWYHFSCF